MIFLVAKGFSLNLMVVQRLHLKSKCSILDLLIFLLPRMFRLLVVLIITVAASAQPVQFLV